jgi:antitoxin (DNA-binding transcriptional repressor) of toxin-antitoxin stability system
LTIRIYGAFGTIQDHFIYVKVGARFPRPHRVAAFSDRLLGVKELKSHLSQYLKLVKSGEVIIVTDHNKIVAEISQPTKVLTDDNTNQKIEAYLDKLQSEGKINRATRSHSLVDSFQSTLISW